MSDFLLDIGANPRARKIIKSLGLPIPLPEVLRRDRKPYGERPLADSTVVVGAATGGQLLDVVAATLCAAGADPVVTSEGALAPFREPGEIFGRPARTLDKLPETARVQAVVFDATGMRDIASLRALYETFSPLVTRVAKSGRVVVLARPLDEDEPELAAAQRALEGFVRSVAKEIGRTGATANLVTVMPGAESRLGPVLRFVLSARSAFITAQPIVVDTRARGTAEPPMVRPLEKRVALVTGAARGIGAATARALAREGAHVLVLDRPADGQAASQLARELGGTAVLADITAPEAAATIIDAVKAAGGLDVIVHNAGVTRDKTLARMKPEQWDGVLGVNLAAVAKLTAALAPYLREDGRMICLSSIAGLAGNVGQTAYATSKAGIVGFVQAAATQWAARGVTVNAIAPGFIETRLTAAIPVAIREVARRLAALGQGGLPEDVAEAVVFLASPGSQGITGRTLRVCGGAFVGA
jgi:3-oxoacyl-[acyl-carrier protein] reductase